MNDSERIAVELAAVDRISLNTIGTSRQMRYAFLARGYKLPDTARNVKNLVMTFFYQLKSNIKEKIKMERRGWKILLHYA